MSNTILIIDDNKEVLENTSEILELSGYNILAAENGKEGLKLITEHTPDLVLCDIEMPEMNGYAVLSTLKNMPAMTKRPFIFMTAKSERADFRKGMDLGADDYLTKPFSGEDLLSLVHARLEKSKKLTLEPADEKGNSKNRNVYPDEKEAGCIFVRHNSLLTRVQIADILYIQALGDYVNIVTTDKHFIIHITLKGIEERLPPFSLSRLHRSYMVSLNHIDNIEGNTAYIGKHPIPIGEMFRKQLNKKLNII
jgi:CheY-like chemotaxis protein